MAEIRVMLVDDHPVVRQGIRALLDSAAGIDVVAEATTGQEALRMAAAKKPDVLLLDMELPDMSGSEIAEQLIKSQPDINILVLSSHDDSAFIAQMLSNGASGYLLKEEAPDHIVEAVRGVARGEKGWLSRHIASKLSDILSKEHETENQLTPRELQVLSQVVEGKTNAEIGLFYGISEKTVEKHLDGVFRKLRVSSRVEAAVLAVREGLVEEP